MIYLNQSIYCQDNDTFFNNKVLYLKDFLFLCRIKPLGKIFILVINII